MPEALFWLRPLQDYIMFYTFHSRLYIIVQVYLHGSSSSLLYNFHY